MKFRFALLPAAVAILVSIGGAAPAVAAPPVGFHATIDDRDVTKISPNAPLRLPPDQTVIIAVDVTNNTGRELTVRSVNLNGKVMGLTFYAFETRVDLVVPAGATESRKFAVELVGLKGQADGLLPGRLDLLDPHRQVIVSASFASDVRGSLASVYGVFGVLVAIITALLLASALIRLAAGRLSVHRWSRGVRFGTGGLGLGLTLTFSLSAFRVVLPTANSWATILLISTALLFVLGYLTPTPAIYLEPEEDELDDPGARFAPSAP